MGAAETWASHYILLEWPHNDFLLPPLLKARVQTHQSQRHHVKTTMATEARNEPQHNVVRWLLTIQHPHEPPFNIAGSQHLVCHHNHMIKDSVRAIVG
jgi:hypothetical protein